MWLRLAGALMLLLGLAMVVKDQLVERWDWLRARMPPGEPYGRDAPMWIAIRVGKGYFFIAFGLLLLLGG